MSTKALGLGKVKNGVETKNQKSLLGPDLAIWLLPRLREYAQKLNELSERSTQFPMTTSANLVSHYEGLFVAEYLRQFATFQVLSLGITKFINSASTLLDHSRLDLEIEEELELRTQEALVSYTTCKFSMKQALDFLKRNGVRTSLEKALDDHQIKLPS